MTQVYKTPAGINADQTIYEQILEWFDYEVHAAGRPVTAPEMAAAFEDVSNSLQPRTTLLTRAGFLERVSGVENPLTGRPCYGYKRTEKPYNAADIVAAKEAAEATPFTWGAFVRHFEDLSDDDAEAFLDRVNKLAEKRWAVA